MLRYLLKRILIIIPMLVMIIFIIYGIMELCPGEPARTILGTNASQEAVDALTIELGYDKPFMVRFVKYLANACKGDLGESWQSHRSVFGEVSARFPETLKLAVFAMLLALLIGIPLGILAAVRQYSIFDSSSTALAMVMASMPTFWLGMMLLILFAVKLKLLPTFGTDDPLGYILPAVSMACPEIAVLLRFTRTTMLESIRMDYVRTARAKGQKERKVVTKHALPNALLPVITVASTEFCGMLGGLVTIETVFSINGVGSLIVTAITKRDVPVVVGSAIFLAFTVMLVMVFIDMLYAFIDPRIKARYTKTAKGGKA